MINTPFTLYQSTTKGSRKNTVYPYQLAIESEEDLLCAVEFDHIFAQMHGGVRGNDNWEYSDVVGQDIDNGDSDNPEEWKTPEQFIKDFADYEFYLVSSKSNNKWKKEQSPRPRYHVYAPLQEKITDKERYNQFIYQFCNSYTHFDKNVKDLARLFFAVDTEDPDFFLIYHPGKSILKRPMTNARGASRPVGRPRKDSVIATGERNTTLFHKALTMYRNGMTKSDVHTALMEINKEKCTPPLDDVSLVTIINSAENYKEETYTSGNGKTYIPTPDAAITYMQQTGYIRIIHGGTLKLTKENKREERFVDRGSFRVLYANILVTFLGEKPVPIADWFLQLHEDDANFPVVSSIRPVFDKPYGYLPEGIFNTFKGFYHLTNDYGDTSYIHQVLRKAWSGGDERVYQYYLNWFAQLVQHPEKKIGVGLGMRSVEGIGKGFIMEGFWERILGEYYVVATDSSILNKQFNAQLEYALIFYYNEAGWVDKNQAGNLKGMVSDKKGNLEKKGVDGVTRDFYFRTVFTTNEDRIVEVDKEQRRWMLTRGVKVWDKTDPFWDLAYASLDNGAPGAFLKELLERDISGFNPRDFPVTEETLAQIELSMNSMELFIEAVTKNEEPIGEMDDSGKVIVPRKAFITYYAEYCKENALFRFSTKRLFTTIRNRYASMFQEFRTSKARYFAISVVEDENIPFLTQSDEKVVDKKN